MTRTNYLVLGLAAGALTLASCIGEEPELLPDLPPEVANTGPAFDVQLTSDSSSTNAGNDTPLDGFAEFRIVASDAGDNLATLELYTADTSELVGDFMEVARVGPTLAELSPMSSNPLPIDGAGFDQFLALRGPEGVDETVTYVVRVTDALGATSDIQVAVNSLTSLLPQANNVLVGNLLDSSRASYLDIDAREALNVLIDTLTADDRAALLERSDLRDGGNVFFADSTFDENTGALLSVEEKPDWLEEIVLLNPDDYEVRYIAVADTTMPNDSTTITSQSTFVDIANATDLIATFDGAGFADVDMDGRIGPLSTGDLLLLRREDDDDTDDYFVLFFGAVVDVEGTVEEDRYAVNIKATRSFDE